MTEVRRVAWPAYEGDSFSPQMFLQGIAGTLELFHLSLVKFQTMVEEATGYAVPVYQRVDQAGQRLPIDERILADTDTLMIFGLDHLVSEEEASPEGNRGARDILEPRRYVSHARAASRRRRVAGHERTQHGVPPSRRSARATPAAFHQIRALADERPRARRSENRWGLVPADGTPAQPARCRSSPPTISTRAAGSRASRRSCFTGTCRTTP